MIHNPKMPEKTSMKPDVESVHYENGTEMVRNACDHFARNGYCLPPKDKYNEKYIQNRIEYKQYCEKNFKPQLRPQMMSPPLPDKKRSVVIEQPRSLDSNLSIVESQNEVNRPGPQTPVKKYTNGDSNKAANYKNIRENFIRSTIQTNDSSHDFKNGLERQSLRFSTTTQKLLVNGKIANAVHNGKISPPSRKANLVRTPSDVVRKISYSSGIHHAEPIAKYHAELLSRSPPTLPPHCPPTSHQL
jgi:hypothetical protein